MYNFKKYYYLLYGIGGVLMINVMLVDDEALVRVAIKALFNWESHGFQIVAEASNAIIAMSELEKTTIDLIITDLKMPISDGISLVTSVQQKYPHICCVVLSAYDDFELTRAAFMAGAADYLLKNNLNEKSFVQLMERLKSSYFQTISKPQSQTPIHSTPNSTSDYIHAIKQLIVNPNPDSSHVCLLDCQLSFVMCEIILESLGDSGEMPNSTNEFLKENLVYKIISEISEFKLYYYSLSPDDYVLFIYNQEASQDIFYSKLKDFFSSLCSNLQSYLNSFAVVGISSLCDSLSNVPTVFSQATTQAQKIFYYNESRICFHHLSVENKIETHDFIHEHINALSSIIQAQNWDKLADYSNNLLDFIATKEYAPARAKRLLTNLEFFILSEISHHHGKSQSYLFDTETLYDRILYADKLEDVRQYFFQFLKNITNISPITRLTFSNYSEIVSNALQYLTAQFKNSEINLSTVAIAISVNPSYLSRLFHKETKKHFNTYLTELRIEHAKTLLQFTKDSIHLISEKSGYNSSKYFITIFKSIEGISPSAYRNQCSLLKEPLP